MRWDMGKRAVLLWLTLASLGAATLAWLPPVFKAAYQIAGQEGPGWRKWVSAYRKS